MKRILTLFVFLITAQNLSAQSPIFKLEGHVYAFDSDAENSKGQPLGNVKVRVLGTDGSIIESYTDPTGYYEFETDSAGNRLIKAECAYIVEVSAIEEAASDGNKYLMAKGQERTDSLTESTVFIKDFALVCASCGCGPMLPTFYFDSTSDLSCDENYCLPDSIDILKEILQQETSIILELSGHCDQFNSERKNRKCALDRSKAVKRYLVENGINPKQLVPKSYGSSKPIVTQNELNRMTISEQNIARQRNNRVSAMVIAFIIIEP